MTYRVFSWYGLPEDDDPSEPRPPEVGADGWRLEASGVSKWELREVLRRLYGCSFDTNTIYVEAESDCTQPDHAIQTELFA